MNWNQNDVFILQAFDQYKKAMWRTSKSANLLLSNTSEERVGFWAGFTICGFGKDTTEEVRLIGLLLSPLVAVKCEFEFEFDFFSFDLGVKDDWDGFLPNMLFNISSKKNKHEPNQKLLRNDTPLKTIPKLYKTYFLELNKSILFTKSLLKEGFSKCGCLFEFKTNAWSRDTNQLLLQIALQPTDISHHLKTAVWYFFLFE